VAKHKKKLSNTKEKGGNNKLPSVEDSTSRAWVIVMTRVGGGPLALEEEVEVAALAKTEQLETKGEREKE
jgi:hypothetical protein